MAHKWQKIPGKRQRHCLNCSVVQNKIKIKQWRADTTRWQWRPLAGRCTVNSMGRPATRRNAILAAIRDSRHTPAEIAAHAGLSIPVTRVALSEAKRQGFIINPRRGQWELAPEEEVEK